METYALCTKRTVAGRGTRLAVREVPAQKPAGLAVPLVDDLVGWAIECAGICVRVVVILAVGATAGVLSTIG